MGRGREGRGGEGEGVQVKPGGDGGWTDAHQHKGDGVCELS